MGKPFVLASWPLWLIPLPYLLFGIVAGINASPHRVRLLYAFGHVISVGSAQAYLSAVSSGMITLTALVFSVMFLMIQMTMSAYSKRLILLFSGNPLGLHALGVFSATFLCALWIAPIRRSESQRQGALVVDGIHRPLLLVLSMVFLALLIQRVALLRITYILQFIGDKGRAVIATMLPCFKGEVAEEIATLRHKADASEDAGAPAKSRLRRRAAGDRKLSDQ